MRSVEPGTILAGKYRLEQLIGRGGMGAVWRAQQLMWEAPVAAKLLSLDLGAAERAGALPSSVQGALFQRFLGEARIAASIRSPHVVQILDHGVDPELSVPFLIMELLDGETLDQLLQREMLERQGPLSPALTAHVLTHVARALTRMHEAGLVHRDLKPSNVFLVRNDDEIIAKVLDFGIAKSHRVLGSATPLTASGQQVGTPFYMSPEQIRGQREVDERADLWALGVIAFECLTGRRPFEGNTLGDLSLKICVDPVPVPSALAPVPRGFDAWFAKAVQRDSAQRFGSAKEAADALRAVLVPELAGKKSMTSLPAHAQRAALPQPLTTTELVTTEAVISSAPTELRQPRRGLPFWAALGVSVLVALGLSVYFHGSSSETSASRATATTGGVEAPPAILVGSEQALQAEAQREAPAAAAASSGPSVEPVADPAGAKPETAKSPKPAPSATPKPARVAPKPVRSPVTAKPEAPPGRSASDLIEDRL